MKKRSLVLAALLFNSAAHAQVGFGGMFPGPGTKHSAGGGGGYTGPGDLQTVNIFYGLRAASAAKRGSNAIQVCDSSNANCTNIPTDATTGDLVTSTTVGGSACNNSTNICNIKIWYNQGTLGSGGDTDGATVQTSRCILTINGSGGGTKVSAVCPDNATYYQTGAITQAQPLTIMATHKVKILAGAHPVFLGNCSAITFYGNATNLISAGAGVTNADVGTTDTNWHGVGTAYSNSTSDAYAIDATTGALGVATGTNGLANSLTLLGDNACSGLYGRSDFEEGGIAFSALSQANIAAINANSKTYWGY